MTTSVAALTHELLESDAAYFEAGAEIEHQPGYAVARLPGLEQLAAACVVQRLQAERLAQQGSSWVQQMERNLSRRKIAGRRLYLQQPCADLERVLAAEGYRCRTEHGLLCPLTGVEPAPEHALTLTPIATDADWSLRLDLARRCARGPDGHLAHPAAWVEMERRRNEAGYMQPYLVWLDGSVCGALGLAERRNLLRLKNLVVDPDCRRQGIGRALAQKAAVLAKRQGYAAAGAFSLENSHAMYEAAGFRSVTTQTEWTKNAVAA